MVRFKSLLCGMPVAVRGQAFEQRAAEHGMQPTARWTRARRG